MHKEAVQYRWSIVERVTHDDGSVIYSWYVKNKGVLTLLDHKPTPTWLCELADRLIAEGKTIDLTAAEPAKPDHTNVALSEKTHAYAVERANLAGVSVERWVTSLINNHKARKGWNNK